MKIKSLFVAVLLMAGVVIAPAAQAAYEKPTVESFTFTPNDVDISGPNLTINFELVVSHPSGIDNSSVLLSLTNSIQFKISSYLYRTDVPVVTTQKRVVFKGSVVLPRELQPGAYVPTLSSVRNNTSAGYQYETGTIESKNIRDLTGAENALLVRNGKDLSLDYTTFIGPTYDTRISFDFKNVVKYNSSVVPILKVGETYNPSDYFELKVSTLKFETKTKSPKVCTATDGKINFISEGACYFSVYTAKTNDYIEKTYDGVAVVTAARVKPILQTPFVPSQNVNDLPKIIELGQVYSAAQGWVLPVSSTPAVCYATANFAKIITGGTCTLNYQTIATSEYAASDVYKTSFEIVKNSQTITFTLGVTAGLATKTVPLAAVASSGGVVSFAATPADICSVTGSTLNLLKPGSCAVTATQPGSGTIASVTSSATVTITGALPVVKKTISCVKGSKTIKKTAISPKCPAGYKLKK